ncbi:MAG: exodeoxyribonuclease VII small subunit [Nitrospiraceae bacterium]|nr:MAG: exodeoxyribonuclease VII small subunit [Nitrospiraceae bacterium]
MNGSPGYKEALEEIEAIVEEIENETVDVDVLAEKVKRAAFLIKYCKAKLKAADSEVKKILKDFEKEDKDAGSA